MRMEKGRPSRTWLVFAASCGFLAGMLVMAALFAIFPDQTRPALANANPIAAPFKSSSPPAFAEATAGKQALEPAPTEVRPTPSGEPPAVTAPEEPQAVAIPSIGVAPVEDLRGRHLDLPVKGAVPEDVHDMFNEMRGGTRRHEAIDMLAPRNTPVVAVEAGTIGRLFFSQAGGITIYQFDPTNTYVYYYAHLERYADGLKEGDKVKRGQLLGYVGTTGNAPRDTPHLHFAIFKMTDEKRWWEGTPIDPFQVLR
ncbi:MAG: peptidoglycan DD-metalloendopeptidase family protein [Acidobacteriota bacterium]|nr:peptidoglycan DD-metalloendopeptidase family protein [Acidobacteriota bacterium]